MVIGRVRHDDALPGFWVHILGIEDALALGLGVLEMTQKYVGIRNVEVLARVFLLCLFENIAIRQRDWCLRIVERHVHHMIDAKDIHCQTL